MRDELRRIATKPLEAAGVADRVRDSALYARMRPLFWRRSEREWTAPRADCPHPEWWTATDGSSTELEVTELVAAFVRALQPDYVVETGTAYGQTARAIGRALRSNGHGSLDTLEVDPLRVRNARRITRGLPVEVVQCTSLEFVPRGRVGFAWLDSLVELRVPECRNFLPYMTPGAVVGFHDTGPQHALRVALDDLSDQLEFLHLPTPRGVSFAQVRPSAAAQTERT